MADDNSLNFVHIIKETCLMKCNTFYEDQCCTSCFKSEGTKITECPSYTLFLIQMSCICKVDILNWV